MPSWIAKLLSIFASEPHSESSANWEPEAMLATLRSGIVVSELTDDQGRKIVICPEEAEKGIAP